MLVIVPCAAALVFYEPRKKKLHLLRSIMGVGAMGFAFYAFSLMPLAEAVSILHTAPLFMTALSVILLRETVGIRRWSAVILGFAGMLLVVRPGSGMLESGSLYMLAAAFLIGCTTIIIRHLGKLDDPVCITFYFTAHRVAGQHTRYLYPGLATTAITGPRTARSWSVYWVVWHNT